MRNFIFIFSFFLLSSITRHPVNINIERKIHFLKYKNNDSILKIYFKDINSNSNSIPNSRTSSLNPTKQSFAIPHNSAEGINPKIGFLIVSGFLIFVLYVIFKVRRLIKSEKK